MKRKFVELHLHLDGSLNLMWTYQKAKEKAVIDPNLSFEDFYDIMFSRNNGHSAESIKKFDLLCDILQEKEDLIEATYLLVKRLYTLGHLYAEIRFASQQHCKHGLSQREALQAVIDGANKAMKECDIKIGIINCLMHKGDSANFNYAQNLKTIEVTKDLLGKGAVGLDLAGYENNCDYQEYASLMKIVKENQIPFTMHAGEMGIGSHILDAVEMGAWRIGHGINCVQDKKILDILVKKQIPMEICVSSNSKPEYNYSKHPIRQLIDAGCKITINTDNMIFSKSDIINEYSQLAMIGVTEEKLDEFTRNAIEAAFCDENTKKMLFDKLKG